MRRDRGAVGGVCARDSGVTTGDVAGVGPASAFGDRLVVVALPEKGECTVVSPRGIGVAVARGAVAVASRGWG